MTRESQIANRIELYLSQIRHVQREERPEWRKRMTEDVLRNMEPGQLAAYIEGEDFTELDELITKPLRSHAFGFARYRLDRMNA